MRMSMDVARGRTRPSRMPSAASWMRGVASSELWGKLLVPELGAAAYEHYLCYDYDAVTTRLHPRVAWSKLAPRVKTQYQVGVWGSVISV